mgnify:CR=1 FL=1
MKKLIYILSLMLACTACNFLETDTYDYLDPDGIYRDEANCMAGLAGVYDVLTTQGCYGQNLWGDLDAGTDILVYNRSYGKDYIQISNYNYNNTDNALKLSWVALYEGINRANDYIDKIENRTDEECGSAANKAMYLGEAKALRALFYMNLVAFWGEVPLRLTPTHDLSTQLMKKSSQADIYAQIISDLEAAGESCRPADELNAPGRISQTTAWALLARAYMWQAGYPVYADTWGKALEYALKVKKSGLHGLYPRSQGGYRQLFINMCSNLYDLTTRESMFEVEFYGNGQTQTNEAGRLGLYLGVTQQTASDDYPYAYGLYDGTKYLFRLYEEADERLWWNIADYKYVTTDGVVSEVERTAAEKAQEDGNAAKWRARYIPERPLSRNNSSINFPVIRYSDVLLMIAECDNEVNNGPTTEAINAINQVRRRAGATEIELKDYAGYERFKQLVLDERTRELCYEVPRRMELRRQGISYFESQLNILKDQALNEKNKKIGYDLDNVKAVPALNYTPRYIYFPIPQAELNVNTICGQTDKW